jgi:hypothetical protein
MFHVGGDTAGRPEDYGARGFPYSFPYPGPTFDQTIDALNENGIMVIGLLPNSGLYGSAYEDTERIVRGTGALNAQGEPLIFRYDVSGTAISQAILEALASAVQVGVSVQAVGDSQGFLAGVEPQIVTNAGPNDTVQFKLLFRGTGLPEQTFDFTLDVLANGNKVIASVPVHVTVPPATPGTLTIDTDKPSYLPPEDATFTITNKLPAFLTRKVFTRQQDFQEATLDGLDASSMPGGLVLAPDVTNGTARLVVDAGDAAHWGPVTFTGPGLEGPESYVDEIEKDHPAAYWRLGETNGTMAIDASENGHDGTYTNGVTLGTTGALITDSNLAASFDGTNDYIVTDFVLNPATNSFTVEAWIKPRRIGSGTIVQQRDNNGTGRTWLYLSSDNGVATYFGGSEKSWNAGTVSTTEWTHVAFVYDNSSHVYTFYKNGAATARGAVTGESTSGSILIGTDKPFVEFYQGSLDEIAIYGNALDPMRVFEHYAAASRSQDKPISVRTRSAPTLSTLSSAAYSEPFHDTGALVPSEGSRFLEVEVTLKGKSCMQAPMGAIHWWPGDGNGIDITGGNHGVLKNGATFAPGLSGEAFSLDGTDDYFETTVASVSGSNPRTVEAWIKTSTSSGNEPILSYGSRQTDYAAWVVTHEGGIVAVRIQNANMVWAAPGVNDGQFHHLAVVYPGGALSNSIAYVDGIALSLASSVNSTITPNTLTNNPVRIGTEVDLSGYFHGQIDEMTIYNRALTASEVAAVFSAGSEGKCKGGVTGDPDAPSGTESANPVLEYLSVGYNTKTLAIDVSVEDTNSVKVANVSRIQLDNSAFGRTNVFTRTFSTWGVSPGSYTARASLVEIETANSILTATDSFSLLTQSPATSNQVLAGSITTDKREYAANETALITSKVRNQGNNYTAGQLGVNVKVLDSTNGVRQTSAP